MAVTMMRLQHAHDSEYQLEHSRPVQLFDQGMYREDSLSYSEFSRGKTKYRKLALKGDGKPQLHYVSASTVAEKPARPSLLRGFIDGAIAGATAGVVVETALYPIDTIKTRLQAARAGGQINLKGLYSGLGGNIAGVLPASALFIGVYEPAKRKLLEIFPDHLSSVAHLSAGAIGGATASLIRVPTEVVKQRMQTGQFTSARTAVTSIVAKEGVTGLYAGFGAFLLRDLPFDAIQFCIYEQLKIVYKKTVKRELYDAENAVMGAFSGAVTGAVTTPLDVIKTRLMIQGSQGHYKGVFDCVTKIVKEEGASTLFKGIGPRVMWIGIGGSIFFTALERTKYLLSQISESKSKEFLNARTV
ncbi:hypothetical protein R1flu_027617 [Riccia fluitans]|uniref:S-adenosylmethionine transporter n=1 Tax=Riccia fluitans TaxID=41844 RepID=A0ABD1XJV8_9MARC